MPVTNRGWLRLTPTGAPHPTWDYLKAQPPACLTLGVSLAVLALPIVVYLVARHLLRRQRSLCSPVLDHPPFVRASEIVDTDTSKQGSGPAVDGQTRGDEEFGDSSTMGAVKSEKMRAADSRINQRPSPLMIDSQWAKAKDDPPSSNIMSRPPPAPPLTPPELSSSVFTFTRRQHSQDSFMHQPNPDYMSSTESPTLPGSPSSPAGAQRRSYTRLIPGRSLEEHTSSPTEQESPETSFLSTSYPPTTSLLPPAPPILGEHGDESRPHRQVEVQGEIISVLDDEGAGWTRHTRVYGGGVCLACAASGGNHGGGFYGANVSPEEMH